MDFYGMGLTPKDNEMRAMRVDRMHRTREAEYVGTRWFDYFNLHPTQATYLFAHLYKEQTRKFCEAYVDIRTAEDARAFTPDDIFSSRDMTSMWLARGQADALGVPYEFLLQFASQRALDRTFQCFPRPNQLYGEEFEIDLKAAWEEGKRTSLRYSRHEHFLAKNLVGPHGSVIQRRHHRYIVEQIKRRHGKQAHAGLLGRLFNEGFMDAFIAKEFFDSDTIQAAQEVVSRLNVSHR